VQEILGRKVLSCKSLYNHEVYNNNNNNNYYYYYFLLLLFYVYLYSRVKLYCCSILELKANDNWLSHVIINHIFIHPESVHPYALAPPSTIKHALH